MIPVHIEQKEYWNEATGEFYYIGPKEPKDIYLEHSLYSIAKWESKYHRFYFGKQEKTLDEFFDYFSMMVVGDDESTIDKDYFKTLSTEEIKRIADYINDPMTATTFANEDNLKFPGKSIQHENMSAEIIYYYMTALNIPFECQYWHFNRLIALIKVCAIESNPDNKKKKKLTSSDLASRRARMEAARAKYSKH